MLPGLDRSRLHSISRRDRVRTGEFSAATERTRLPVSADLGPGNLNFPPLSQVHHEAANICALNLLLSSSNAPNDDLIEWLDTFFFSYRTLY